MVDRLPFDDEILALILALFERVRTTATIILRATGSARFRKRHTRIGTALWYL